MNIFDNIKLPELVAEYDSKYNGKIQVVKTGSTKKVVVNKITQSISKDSPSCKRLVWGKAADLLKRENPDAKRIIVFGMGGATMQHLIVRDFPGIELYSVELDPVMIQVATDHFDLNAIPSHTIINDDAFRVVVEPEEYGLDEYMFDTAVVDIFQGDAFPELGNSGNFFAALKKLVMPGGLVIINRIYLDKHQLDVDNFIEYVEMVLTDVKSEIVAGYTNSDNVLIYGRA